MIYHLLKKRITYFFIFHQAYFHLQLFDFLSVTPISRKRGINALVFLDYFVILLFYFLLAFTGIFAFEEINDLYTLNFQPEPDEAWYMKVIHYFLSLFPVFTLSTNFPIIAITLRNNLKTLFLTEGRSLILFRFVSFFYLLAYEFDV